MSGSGTGVLDAASTAWIQGGGGGGGDDRAPSTMSFALLLLLIIFCFRLVFFWIKIYIFSLVIRFCLKINFIYVVFFFVVLVSSDNLGLLLLALFRLNVNLSCVFNIFERFYI